MLKVEHHSDYPPEEGRYLRGNDYSPVAVAIILNCDADKIPTDLEQLVRMGLESGAALSGTVQTENIGFEEIRWNLVANPNIRYLVLGGPESEGHQTGQAMKALIDNGIDKRKRIIGVKIPHPALINLPIEFIDRFRDQLELIDFNLKKILRSFVRPSGHATRKILQHFGRIHCMIQVLILQSHSVGG